MGRAVECSSRGTLSDTCRGTSLMDIGALSTVRKRAENATAGKTRKIERRIIFVVMRRDSTSTNLLLRPS